MEGAHVIEVNNLVISMTCKRNAKKTEFPLLHKIRRMPFNVDNDIYEPSVVSIGPYHHKRDGTLEMEKTKWESFGYILGLNPEKKMRDYLEAIAGLEEQIRSCYANPINTNSDELLKMMLLDGCLILCTLYGTEGPTQPISNLNMSSAVIGRYLGSEQNVISTRNDAGQQINSSNKHHDDSFEDAYYKKQWYISFSKRDILLLENQIPFFIIVNIFELVTNSNSFVTMMENAARFMEDLPRPYPKAILKFDRLKEFHHLLHLCHLYFKPNLVQVKSNPSATTSYDDEAQSLIAGQQLLGWRQSSQYYKAGVEFKKREICIENPHSLLDIGFCEGVIEIPCLTIDPNTYCLFRNLLTFEDTCPQFGNYFTAYVVFLCQLISKPDDVSLLMKRGIIVHQLDSDAEVSDLFKMLVEGVSLDFNSDHYLKHICHEMEVHYQMQRPRWREWLGSIGSKLPSWPHENKPNQLGRRPSPEECEECV